MHYGFSLLKADLAAGAVVQSDWLPVEGPVDLHLGVVHGGSEPASAPCKFWIDHSTDGGENWSAGPVLPMGVTAGYTYRRSVTVGPGLGTFVRVSAGLSSSPCAVEAFGHGTRPDPT